jgi:hypothetical protein
MVSLGHMLGFEIPEESLVVQRAVLILDATMLLLRLPF